MKRFALVLGLSAVASTGTALAGEKAFEAIPLSLAWQVSIDAQGHVTQLQATADRRADRMPQVRAAVEQKIRGWHFIPGSIDGTPQPTQTTLSVSTTLLAQNGSDYQIRIDDARTGARVAKVVPPRFPQDAARRGSSGLVVLHVDFDADGKVAALQADTVETKATGSLVKAALDAAKTWTFQPEQVGGHGVAGSIVLPVCFQVFPMGSRVPDVPGCAWTPPGRHAALAQGESLSLNPAARLAADVIDHAP